MGNVVPQAESTYSQISRSREVFSVLVEADSHDSVGSVEGLLHSVSVMDVNINVEDSLMVLEQLQNGEYNVIDVAETTGLGLLSVMESTRPVNGDVGSLFVQFYSGRHGTASRELAKLIEAIENRTILEK